MYYLFPFELAVTDGGARGMMCSYNALDVDGAGSTPACAMGSLQNGVARARWGFDGYIVSDCGAPADFLRLNDCSGCSETLPCHDYCDDTNYTGPCPACHSQCVAQRACVDTPSF